MRCEPVSRCENWTRRAPRTACLRRHRRGPSRHGAGRGALATRPPLRRGEPVPAAAEVVLLCVPDGKIAEAAAAVPAGPAARPLLRRDRARRVRRPRGLLAAPADVRADRAASRACCAARARPWTARAERALDVAAHARRGARACARRASAAEDRVAYHAAGAIAANFLVALEACAERLAATDRDHPRAARAARAGHRRAVGAAGPGGGADGRRSRAATRAPSSAIAPRSPSARRSCCRSGPSWPRSRAPWRVGGRGHEDDPHHRRAARLARQRARRAAGRSASCRRWAPSTPATTR